MKLIFSETKAIEQTNLAVLSFLSTPTKSSNIFLFFSSWLILFPPNRAVYTPGAPFKKSISSPLSSANTDPFTSLLKLLAFINAFSQKAVPVSSNLISYPSSFIDTTFSGSSFNIAFISIILPILPDAITSLFMSIYHLNPSNKTFFCNEINSDIPFSETSNKRFIESRVNGANSPVA